MSAKELVKSFYESDLANDPNLIPQFFHKDCQMHWNSSKGFSILSYDDIVDFFEGIRESFHSLRFQLSHLLEDDNFVASRHTLYGRTIENPDNDAAMAHYATIWEVKEGKLYRGHEISQPADENTIKSNSFKEIKI